MDFAQRAATTKCLLSFRFIVSCVGALDVGHHSAPEQACSIWSSCLVLPPGCRFFLFFFPSSGSTELFFFLFFPPVSGTISRKKKEDQGHLVIMGYGIPLFPARARVFVV